MKKSKLWSLLLTFGAIGLAIGGANLKHAPNVFAHHEDHLTHEVEGHSKVRPTLTPERAIEKPSEDAFEIKDKATFESFMGISANATKNAYLSANIDLGGSARSTGIPSSHYVGIFEGNGFKVHNFTVNYDNNLFYWIGSAGIVRNLELDYNETKGLQGGVAFQNDGLVENVNVSLRITSGLNNVGGISRMGSGTYESCNTNWYFSDNNSSNTIFAINSQAATYIDCTYYRSGANPPALTTFSGITLRTDEQFPGAPVTPKVKINSGYVEKIYVEEDPKSTEITAQIENSEEIPTWSIAELNDGTIASVEVDEDGVATVTALAKGNVTFKFKATIDGVDYLSTLVTIKVLNNSTDYDIPENPIYIGTAAQFKAFFDGGAGHLDRNVLLTDDIDLEDYIFPIAPGLGKAGSYSGIFEGHGYTIKNLRGKGLFNIINSGSEVRNFNLEFEPTASAGGIIASINDGLVKNVKIKAQVKSNINSYGGISQIGSGQFVDCRIDWIISNASANTLHAVVEADSGKSITNCSWTMNGSTTAVGSQGNAQVTRNLVREGALGFQLLVMGYEGGDIATEECATKWAAANVKWNAISADSRAQVRTDAEFEDAWLRYQHWALANGSTPDAGGESGLNQNNNLNLTATIIIGAIGLTTLLGYYFINKKKAHA